ncbi:hypothetical protein O9993_15280 [Vibrio lentus]|nr:hypothetical protein [Vibrio lentus]
MGQDLPLQGNPASVTTFALTFRLLFFPPYLAPQFILAIEEGKEGGKMAGEFV